MKNKLKVILLVIVFGLAIFDRAEHFSQVSKDIYAYERAITDLFTGTNPYKWTIESYNNPDDPGNHGYAYLPGLLFLYGGLYLISLIGGMSHIVMWKIPVLLADIGVGILLVRYFHKKSFLALIVALLLWFFNPYSYIRGGYTLSDPIPIFFMFLALIYLEKDDVIAGASYALSIVFKTFPIILFPLFLLKSKKKVHFIASAVIVGLFFSLPFMGSVDNFITYLQGALFVHGDRFIQGRPFLFYISYYYKVELFQILPFKFYSLMSIFFPWVVILFTNFVLKLRSKYILSLLAFLSFYLFTPVLNRTYTLWFLPVLILAAYKISERWKPLYYLIIISYYAFYSWYLLQWKDGFHIWRP